jgi:hypothetical protein
VVRLITCRSRTSDACRLAGGAPVSTSPASSVTGLVSSSCVMWLSFCWYWNSGFCIAPRYVTESAQHELSEVEQKPGRMVSRKRAAEPEEWGRRRYDMLEGMEEEKQFWTCGRFCVLRSSHASAKGPIRGFVFQILVFL